MVYQNKAPAWMCAWSKWPFSKGTIKRMIGCWWSYIKLNVFYIMKMYLRIIYIQNDEDRLTTEDSLHMLLSFDSMIAMNSSIFTANLVINISSMR